MRNIGFMQGRLSDQVNGEIQAFPVNHWEHEFEKAQEIGLDLMEWTLDADGLYANPLMTTLGRIKIIEHAKKFKIKIPSLTADCCMQFPFWKSKSKSLIEKLKSDLLRVCEACSELGIGILVLPVLDNGQIESASQERCLLDFLLANQSFFADKKMVIALECDYEPKRYRNLMSKLDGGCFGVNYDTGNSAAFGFDLAEEFSAVGNRIVNVHIKDRILSGPTVPLLTGNTDFPEVFKNLKKIGYSGNYILQTARAVDGQHQKALLSYHKLIQNWLIETGF